MLNGDLNEATLQLLRTDPRTINEIAGAAGVNRHWLAKYRQGRFKNPGILRVQALYLFLARGVQPGRPDLFAAPRLQLQCAEGTAPASAVPRLGAGSRKA